MHCRNFALGIGRQIIQDYVDTGNARFVYRHFAILGEESVWAAEATECADEQGRFWDYHDTLFENWTGTDGNFAFGNLVNFAANLGLDANQFSSCMADRRYLDRVRADSEYAQSIGVTSTPSVFVNGERVSGEYENFRQAIEDALAAAQ